MALSSFITNYISFAVIAVSGLGLNWAVDFYYGPNVLGIFNTFMAWYFVTTQLSTLGQQISIQNFLPRTKDDPNQTSKYISSSLTLSLAAGLITSLALLVGIFIAPDQSHFLAWLAAASLLVGANKVLVFSLAATARYHTFAIAQALRPILLFVTILLLGTLKTSPDTIFIPFVVAEIGLLLLGLLVLHKFIQFKNIDLANVKHLARYGVTGAFGLGVSELNTRVDIIVLSLLATNEKVAIFSISLIFFEGYYQLLMVIRNIVAQKVTHLHHNFKTDELKAFLKKSILRTYGVLLPVGLIVIVLAPYIVEQFSNSDLYKESLYYASIVITAQMLFAGPLVFENIYSILNRPGLYSINKVIVLTSNIVFQWLFFKWWGLVGTSVATAISFVTLGTLNFYGLRYAVRPQSKTV